jgi:hypothetical protein
VRYRILFKLSNRQKQFVDYTVRIVADVVGPYTGVARSYTDVAGPYTNMTSLIWQTVGSCEVQSFLNMWHIF